MPNRTTWKKMPEGTMVGDPIEINGEPYVVLDVSDAFLEDDQRQLWAVVEPVAAKSRVGMNMEFKSSLTMRLTPKYQPTQWEHLLVDDSDA